MLLCLGRRVEFDLARGGEIAAPVRHGLLTDPHGDYWPRCSLLVCRFLQGDREATEEELGDGGLDYFGKTLVTVGSCDLPSPHLSDWQKLGEVKTVYYERAGKAAGRYRHKFNKPRGLQRVVFALKGAGKKPVVLFKYRGEDGIYRLEMPSGCIIDDRGIVMP